MKITKPECNKKKVKCITCPYQQYCQYIEYIMRGHYKLLL